LIIINTVTLFSTPYVTVIQHEAIRVVEVRGSVCVVAKPFCHLPSSYWLWSFPRHTI